MSVEFSFTNFIPDEPPHSGGSGLTYGNSTIELEKILFTPTVSTYDNTPIPSRLKSIELQLLSTSSLTQERIFEIADRAKDLSIAEFNKFSANPFSKDNLPVLQKFLTAEELANPISTFDGIVAILLVEPRGKYELKFEGIRSLPEMKPRVITEKRVERREELYRQFMESASIVTRLTHLFNQEKRNYLNLTPEQCYAMITIVAFGKQRHSQIPESWESTLIDPLTISEKFSQLQRRAVRLAAIQIIKEIYLLKQTFDTLVIESCDRSPSVLVDSAVLDKVTNCTTGPRIALRGRLDITGLHVEVSDTRYEELRKKLDYKPGKFIYLSPQALDYQVVRGIYIYPASLLEDDDERRRTLGQTRSKSLIQNLLGHGRGNSWGQLVKVNERIDKTHQTSGDLLASVNFNRKEVLSNNLLSVQANAISLLVTGQLTPNSLDMLGQDLSLIGSHEASRLEQSLTAEQYQVIGKLWQLSCEDVMREIVFYSAALRRATIRLKTIFKIAPGAEPHNITTDSGEYLEDIGVISRRFVGLPLRASDLILLVPPSKAYRLHRMVGISNDSFSREIHRHLAEVPMTTDKILKREGGRAPRDSLYSTSEDREKYTKIMIDTFYPRAAAEKCALHLQTYPDSKISEWCLQVISGSIATHGSSFSNDTIELFKNSLYSFLASIRRTTAPLYDYGDFVLNQLLRLSNDPPLENREFSS